MLVPGGDNDVCPVGAERVRPFSEADSVGDLLLGLKGMLEEVFGSREGKQCIHHGVDAVAGKPVDGSSAEGGHREEDGCSE